MTEDKIKKYFLGELSETDADSFEIECAQNPELAEQSQMIESEMIDAYLLDELSASERISFKNNYLNTDARYEKLKFAQAFLNNFKEKKDVFFEPEKVVLVRPNWFSQLFPRLVFAGIAAFLLLGSIVVVWRNSTSKQEIVKQENNIQISTPKIDSQNNLPVSDTNIVNQTLQVNTNSTGSNSQNTVNSKKTPELKPTSKPVEQIAPSLTTFILLPVTLRSEGDQSIKVASTVSKVNLQLKLPKDAGKYQTYKASVKTVEGETVFLSTNLKTPNLIIPADKLENRTYVIFLEGQNSQNPEESITEYTFRVRR